MTSRFLNRLSAWLVTVLAIGPALRVDARGPDVAPLPSVYTASDVYALAINDVPVPVVRYSSDYDYALAAVGDGPSRFRVTRRDGRAMETVTVSPLKLAIKAQTQGPTATFAFDRPQYLIVEIPGLRRLVIATDPRETDRPPSTGPGVHNVTAAPYHADQTGATSASHAVQAAVNDAAAEPSGKGIVYVPAGVYRLSQLGLLSNISLYLEAGAVLRCDGEAADFQKQFRKKSIGHDGFRFIAATGARNVRIYGRGTIDGNGKAIVKRLGLANHLLAILNCSDVTLDGVTLRDSGLWGTVIGNSRNVTLTNTKHFNFLDVGENDCVDVCNSQDVTVDRSIAISLDDPYSAKTWEPTTDVASQWPGEFGVCRDVVFNDCVAWTRCFAFKIGAGVLRTQEAIRVTKAVVYDAAHAIGISHSYGRADVRGVVFEDIDVERIQMDCLGRSWARFMIDNRNKASTAGGIENVRVRDVNVRDAGRTPVRIEGLNESRTLRDVMFERVRMPGRDGFARTLDDLGVRGTRFAENVSVKP